MELVRFGHHPDQTHSAQIEFPALFLFYCHSPAFSETSDLLRPGSPSNTGQPCLLCIAALDACRACEFNLTEISLIHKKKAFLRPPGLQ